MFELPFFRRKRAKVTPTGLEPSGNQVLMADPVAAEKKVEPSLTLVSKEDIYYRKGNHPVLLMKAGQEVQVELIPKLLKFGIQPEQFLMAPKSDLDSALLTAALPEARRMMTPPSAYSGSSVVRNSPWARKTFAVYEPDDRCMKRVLDCLTLYGIPNGNVHPVVRQDHLMRTLEKNQPEVLLYDFVLDPDSPAITKTIQALRRYDSLQCLILMMHVPSQKDSLRQEVMELVKANHASVLFKPINRFQLSEELTSSLANS